MHVLHRPHSVIFHLVAEHEVDNELFKPMYYVFKYSIPICYDKLELPDDPQTPHALFIGIITGSCYVHFYIYTVCYIDRSTQWSRLQ